MSQFENFPFYLIFFFFCLFSFSYPLILYYFWSLVSISINFSHSSVFHAHHFFDFMNNYFHPGIECSFLRSHGMSFGLLLDDTLSQALSLLISLLHEVSETILIILQIQNEAIQAITFPMPFTTKSLYAISSHDAESKFV